MVDDRTGDAWLPGAVVRAGDRARIEVTARPAQGTREHGQCVRLRLALQAAESGVYGFSPRRSDVVFMCLKEDDPAYQQPVTTKAQ